MTGRAQLGPDVVIYDAQQGGSAIARFTGAPSSLRVGGFPAGQGRARVVTATGSGGFKITGFVEESQLPVFTQRRIPVVAGHLWIGSQREVRVVSGATNRLGVEKSLVRPLKQDFTGWGSCDAFGLTGGVPPAWDVPDNARGWKVKRDSLALFGGWEGNPPRLATLSNAHGMLLWGTARQGGFVQLHYHGEIVVEAWAKIGDLLPLPAGELEDSLAQPVRRHNPPRLRPATVARVVTTTKPIDIRDEAKSSGRVIGVIEPNTETYVLHEMAGWASVLPKSLHVAPPSQDVQFWVPTDKLGLED